MLFFREDTWHRTQDMDVNRLGLILDILRLPFRDQPHGMAFPVTQRTRQPAVVDRLLRLPMPAYRQMLRNATAPANSVGVGSSEGVVVGVAPVRGRVFLFPHVTPHSGAACIDVPKVMLRAEVAIL